jgi:signal-transduction protein with cAMP-binding, CBS, and nucleotidyltransferase domain
VSEHKNQNIQQRGGRSIISNTGGNNATGPSNVGALMASHVGEIMRADVAILESDKTTDVAIEAMQEKNARNVLVSVRGEIVGIVSKTDILFKVTSQGRNPGKVRLREIMTSPVLAVNPQTTVREALAIMDKKKVRQLMVHAYAAVLGMINREEISERIEQISLSLEDAALAGTPACIIDTKTITYMKDTSKAKFQCPYCGSPFDDKEALSKHIDRLHEETGVLEGDYRKMVH